MTIIFNQSLYFSSLFWTENSGCRIKRYSFSTGTVSVTPASVIDGCAKSLAIQTSEQRIYWFSSAMSRTLHSMDYNWTNKITHYVDTNQRSNPYSLVIADRLLIWGGGHICMNFHDVLSNVTHQVNCSQRGLFRIVFYENGKKKLLLDLLLIWNNILLLLYRLLYIKEDLGN